MPQSVFKLVYVQYLHGFATKLPFGAAFSWLSIFLLLLPLDHTRIACQIHEGQWVLNGLLYCSIMTTLAMCSTYPLWDVSVTQFERTIRIG